MSKLKPKNIVISRTDAIGDVILTIPCAGVLKKEHPDCKVFFLGRTYTKDIIALSSHIDEFINWDDYQGNHQLFINLLKEKNIDTFIHTFPHKEIAKLVMKAKIPNRIGTNRRLHHFLTCNIKVPLSRKNSNLHESQLNIKLMTPLLKSPIPKKEELYHYYGIPHDRHSDKSNSFIHKSKKNIILHPKSHGSAFEWGMKNFSNLISDLLEQDCNVIITGTQKEKDFLLQDILIPYEGLVQDSTGKLSLEEFINLISQADALVAASTGPLHIASMLGINAIGLYASAAPFYPQRWGPIGRSTQALIPDESDSRDLSLIQPKVVSKIISELS